MLKPALTLELCEHSQAIAHREESGGIKAGTVCQATSWTAPAGIGVGQGHQPHPGTPVFGDHHTGALVNRVHQPGQLVASIPQAHLSIAAGGPRRGELSGEELNGEGLRRG